MTCRRLLLASAVAVLAPEVSKLSSCSPAVGPLAEVTGNVGAVFSYATRALLPAEEK